ncbi:hypothetical protein D9R21_05830, partial [Spiroplasma endosymbiont of Megaselia nigra]
MGTSTISLVACDNNTKIHEYTKKQLQKLKEENKINTKDKNIKNNLEWITPQERRFNTVDNKWYFVVWKPNNENFCKISKFKNDTNLG